MANKTQSYIDVFIRAEKRFVVAILDLWSALVGFVLALIQNTPTIFFLLVVALGWIMLRFFVLWLSPVMVHGAGFFDFLLNGMIDMINIIDETINIIIKILHTLSHRIAEVSIKHIDHVSKTQFVAFWNELSTRCTEVNTGWGVMRSVFVMTLSPVVCPYARLAYPLPYTGPVADAVLSPFTVDPTPWPGNNCRVPDKDWPCVVLGGGYLLLTYVPLFFIGLLILYYFFKPLKHVFMAMLHLLYEVYNTVKHVVQVTADYLYF